MVTESAARKSCDSIVVAKVEYVLGAVEHSMKTKLPSSREYVEFVTELKTRIQIRAYFRGTGGEPRFDTSVLGHRAKHFRTAGETWLGPVSGGDAFL